MRDITKGKLVAAGIGVVTALAVAAIVTGNDGCTPQARSQVVTDLGPGASCALPIIVNGLISGQPVAGLIDAALTCAGETIDGIIALVTSLEGAPADAAPVAPAALAGYRLGLSELHAAALARKAGK